MIFLRIEEWNFLILRLFLSLSLFISPRYGSPLREQDQLCLHLYFLCKYANK